MAGKIFCILAVIDLFLLWLLEWFFPRKVGAYNKAVFLRVVYALFIDQTFDCHVKPVVPSFLCYTPLPLPPLPPLLSLCGCLIFESLIVKRFWFPFKITDPLAEKVVHSSLVVCCCMLIFFFFFFLLLEYRYGTLLSRTERQMEFQRRNHNIWSNSVSDRQEKTNRLFSREMTFAKRTRCEITRKCYVKAWD